MRRLPIVVVASVLLFGSLSACTSKSGSSAPPDCTVVTGSTFTITAKNLAFTKNVEGKFVNLTCLSVKVGQKVTYTFDNEDSGIQHNFEVWGARFKTDLANGPNKQTLVVTIPEPGHYSFDCKIHANMSGDYYVTK